MANRFTVEGRFTAVDKMSRVVKKIQGKIGKFSKGATSGIKDVGRMFTKFKVGFIAAGAALAGAFVAAGAAMKSVVDAGLDFEQQMASASAKFGPEVSKGTEAFEELKEAAKDVGATTEFTATEAAGGLVFLAKAGFESEQAIAALPGLVDLATASELDLARASDIASDALGAFGLASEDAETQAENLARINDVLAATSTSANTDVDQLFETMKQSGKVATASGASIETWAAFAGTMAQETIKGGRAGRSMKTMFLNLAGATPKAEAALAKLNTEIGDDQGNMRDMIDIVEDLNKGFEDFGEVETQSLMKDLFGKEGITGATTILDKGAPALREYRRELENANGATGDMAEVMRDTTKGDIAGMNSAIEAMKLEIFEVVKGPLRAMVSGLTDWARANKDVIATGIEDTVTFLKNNMWLVVAVLTAVALILGAIAAVLLIVVVTAFILMIPFLLFWGVILLIIAAFDWLVENVPKFLDDMTEGIKDAWKAVMDFFRPAIEFIVGLWEILKIEVMKKVQPVIDFVNSAVKKIKAFFKPLTDFIGGIWTGIKEKAAELWDKLTGKAGKTVQKIKSAFTPIKEFFQKLWEDVVSIFDDVVGPIVDSVKSLFGAVRGVGQQKLAQGESEGAAAAPEVVTPAERTAKTVQESHSSARAEVVVSPEPGTRAREGGSRTSGGGARVTVLPSGVF